MPTTQAEECAVVGARYRRSGNAQLEYFDEIVPRDVGLTVISATSRIATLYALGRIEVTVSALELTASFTRLEKNMSGSVCEDLRRQAMLDPFAPPGSPLTVEPNDTIHRTGAPFAAWEDNFVPYLLDLEVIEIDRADVCFHEPRIFGRGIFSTRYLTDAYFTVVRRHNS